ncbi:MAG: hypothetical protein Q4C58_10340 [Eubacteriales bacterium]|nr:hypothetical protein [Eubacteriales bacterium]
MELEKYIEATKKVINAAYVEIEAALMKYSEAQEKLKNQADKYSEDGYREQYQAIVSKFDTDSQAAVSKCRAAIQEQKSAYMKVVSAYYTPDGGRIDLNDMNLIKSGLPMTVDEVCGMIEKHSDNPTMLRIIEKYAAENKMMDKINEKSISYTRMLVRAKDGGKREERIFNTFVNLAGAGLNHPDEHYTMFQSRLDVYERDAHLDLLKAKLYIDPATEEEIKKIEQEIRDENNEKNKHLDRGWGFHPYC